MADDQHPEDSLDRLLRLHWSITLCGSARRDGQQMPVQDASGQQASEHLVQAHSELSPDQLKARRRFRTSLGLDT
jgi:hypothetical protein